MLVGDLDAVDVESFSTLQRVEIAEIVPELRRIRGIKGFSTLQRVEIAEM